MKQDLSIPVIAVDGGAGTGKGTVTAILARKLGFHSLDSGVLYRLVTLKSLRLRVGQPEEFTRVALNLDFSMEDGRIFLGDDDVTTEVRTSDVDRLVPIVSKVSGVRAALQDKQLSMRRRPGLVAEGRDMCYIYDTSHRFFFFASQEERARRCVKRAHELGLPTGTFQEVLQAIAARDFADSTREDSPLRPHQFANVIDTTHTKAEEVADQILGICNL